MFPILRVGMLFVVWALKLMDILMKILAVVNAK